MRLIIWIVAALAVVYGGYWAITSRSLRSEIETTATELRAEGLADYTALDIGGFPGRFDITVTEPRLATADGQADWSAPEFRVFALAYRPNHVIVALPQTQHLRVGSEQITVQSDDLNASAVFGLAPELPVDHAQAVGTGVAVVSDSGWGVTANEVRAAIRRGDGETAQQVGLELIGLTLSGLPAEVATSGGALPATGERFHLDAVLDFDRPLDRYAPAQGLRIRAVDIRSLALDWGPAGVTASGTVRVMPDGRPEGRLDLSVRNWRAALKLASALGLISAETVPTVDLALENLALLDGDAEVLTLPLVFSEGLMSIGPVPLGLAPSL